jgi:GAF domain-containing protein
MAKRGQKAGKRATAPTRAEPVREPKSSNSKSERLKSELRAPRVRQTASAGIPRTADPQKIVEQLQRRLDESLQQQTATADVLKVISRSGFDLQTVLETLVKSAMALCDADTGAIFQKRGDLYHMTAGQGHSPEVLTYAHDNPLTPGMGSNVGRVALTGKVVQIPDVEADPDYQAFGYQRVGYYRAMLGVPIMRDGKVEGVFSLARPEPGPFTERQVELVQTFADQAVIAIENTRLFNETKEALEHQTATSELLQVISSSMADAQPVFERILDSIERLFDFRTVAVFLAPGDGLLHLAARRNWRRLA